MLADQLRKAAFAGDVSAAKHLLALGCAIDGSGDADTPLRCAIEGEQWEMARWLVEKGANPNAPGPGGWRPLHEIVDYMFDAQNQSGPQPALEAELLSLAQWLVGRGADPALTDDQGRAAWDIAESYGYAPALRTLSDDSMLEKLRHSWRCSRGPLGRSQADGRRTH
jgi:uncharacterized protein